MLRVASLALVPALLVGGVAMNTSVLMVDVQGPDSPDMALPVPLPLARAALAFAPEEAERIEAHDLAAYLPHARRIVEELADAPDAVFVDVRDRHQHVRVERDGDVLRVRAVDGGHTTADVSLPLKALERALRAYDTESGSFRTADLLSALADAPGGPLVHVRDGEQEVEIRIWRLAG